MSPLLNGNNRENNCFALVRMESTVRGDVVGHKKGRKETPKARTIFKNKVSHTKEDNESKNTESSEREFALWRISVDSNFSFRRSSIIRDIIWLWSEKREKVMIQYIEHLIRWYDQEYNNSEVANKQSKQELDTWKYAWNSVEYWRQQPTVNLDSSQSEIENRNIPFESEQYSTNKDQSRIHYIENGCDQS